MITITPSVSNIVDVGALTGDVSVRVDGIASYENVKPDQWFWLFMTHGDEEWVIVQPVHLTNALIDNGVEGRILKSSLLRLPSDSRLMLTAYLKGKVADVANIQIVNSGGDDDGGGHGEYDVEDFEDQSFGTIGSILNAKFITFNFRNPLEPYPEIQSGPSGGKQLKFPVYINRPISATFINKTYSTVSFDITASAVASVSCSSLNPRDGRTQKIPAGATQHVEFIMPNMETLTFNAELNSTPPTITIDNLKMKKSE